MGLTTKSKILPRRKKKYDPRDYQMDSNTCVADMSEKEAKQALCWLLDVITGWSFLCDILTSELREMDF
jgi:hypothetical protein